MVDMCILDMVMPGITGNSVLPPSVWPHRAALLVI